MFAQDLSLEERKKIAEKIAKRVVEMKLSTIAIVFLESSKPLSYVGSQLMVFFNPIVGAFLPSTEFYDKLTAFFEDRENIELLIQKIEEIEERREKDERKK